MSGSKYSGPLSSYTQAVADQTRLWIPLPIMNQAIQNLKNASPATQAGRQLIIDTLASLIPAQPYAIVDGQTQLADLRFSTSTNAGTALTAANYVAAFRDGWSEVITQLQSAADFAMRLTEKGVNGGSPAGTLPNADSMISQQNDAQFAIRKAIQTADRLISNCTGIFNYHTFEARYQLTWGTAVEPPPKIDTVRTCELLGSLDAAFAVAAKIQDQALRNQFLAPLLPQAIAQNRTIDLFNLMNPPDWPTGIPSK